MTAQSLLRALLVMIGVSSSEAFLVACRKDAPSGAAGELADSGPPALAESPSEPDDASVDDATGRAARGVEARADEARRDGGAIDPACAGGSLSLLGAAADERCTVSEREWNALTNEARPGGDGGKGGGLRQEARREGEQIVLSLVNGGTTPLSVPLRFHPARPELAFSVLAEDDRHAVFELAPPLPDALPVAPRVEDAGARPRRRSALLGLDGGSSFTRVHSARISLAPGGSARARLAIDPRIVKRLDRSCADGGADASDCSPPRLPKGHAVLYVGQLVVGIDAGPPARVEWDAP